MSGVPAVPVITRTSGTGNLNDVNADPSLDFPSTDDGLNKKIANYISFTKNGITEKAVIRESFPGFLAEAFQGTIQSVTAPISVSAESYYTSKDNITFLVNPGAAYYNPSLMRLKLPIKFQNADDSDLSTTTIAVNAFVGCLFKSIDVSTMNGEKMITPPSIENNIRSYLLRQLKKIPPNKLKYMDYSYVPDVVHVATRDSTSVTAADRTNDNIKSRISKWHARQKAGYTYYLDMGMLSDFFFNGLTQEKLKIVINLETNMQKILERTDKQTDPSIATGKFVFTGAPQLLYNAIQQTSVSSMYFNSTFNSMNAYDYSRNVVHNEKRSIEMNGGGISCEFTFAAMTGQMDFLRLQLEPRDSVYHQNAYCTYDVDLITTLVDTITIYNYYVGSVNTTLVLDLKKDDDKNDLYNSYLAYMMESCTLQSPKAYVNNQLLDSIPAKADYFTNTTSGLPLIIDMRKAKGYTLPKIDAIVRSDKNLRVEIKLKSAVTSKEPMVATAYGIAMSGRYTMVKDITGAVSTIYLPYNHT